MHDLIASQFLDDYLLLRPGSAHGIKIGSRRHRELVQAAATGVRRGWSTPRGVGGPT